MLETARHNDMLKMTSRQSEAPAKTLSQQHLPQAANLAAPPTSKPCPTEKCHALKTHLLPVLLSRVISYSEPPCIPGRRVYACHHIPFFNIYGLPEYAAVAVRSAVSRSCFQLGFPSIEPRTVQLSIATHPPYPLRTQAQALSRPTEPKP